MKSSFKKLPGSGVELSVSIDLSEFKGYMDRAFEARRAELAIKGFRPGMVPESLAREAISQKAVFDDAAERAIKVTLAETAEKNNWTIIDRPRIEIQEDPAAFSYIATLSLFPDVDISEYATIAEKERAALATKKAALTVSDKELEDALLWLRTSRATLTELATPAEKGNVIDIDMTSSEDPKPHHDRFVLGNGRFMPGFEEKLVGAAAGKNLLFSLTGPADYWKESLRGTEISFDVTVNKIFERVLPAADDAFAQSLGSIKTFDELRTNMRAGILAEKIERESEAAAQKMLESIAQAATIDIPEAMILRIKEQDASLTDNDARKKIAQHLVIYEIAEKEGLQPTDDEIAREIAHYHAGAKGPEPVDAKRLHDYIYERIQQKNVYAKLLGTDSY